jgi:hypothetical protein
MARTAIAILTPRARRANVSRWVEAMECGRKPHANIPKETSTDTGTHSTCPADVLPIPYRTYRSGPTSLGAFPRLRSRIGRRALFIGAHGMRSRRICKGWSETARWNEGPVRASARVNGNRARAGMWDLHEPTPASKKRRSPECGKTPPAPASKKRRARGNVCRTRYVNDHVTCPYLY